MKIKFKKEYNDKLIEMSIRDKFEEEFRKSCKELGETLTVGLAYLNRQPNFLCFFTGVSDFESEHELIDLVVKIVKQDKDENKQDRESGASNRGYLSSINK